MFISKLVQPKELDINEIEMMDSTLQSLKLSSFDKFQIHSKNLEVCLQDLEVGVERISKKFIRTKVTFYIKCLSSKGIYNC